MLSVSSVVAAQVQQLQKLVQLLFVLCVSCLLVGQHAVAASTWNSMVQIRLQGT